HVDRDPVERAHLLAEPRAVVVAHAPGARGALAVEALDAIARVAQRPQGHLAHRALRRRELLGPDREIRRREVDPVEAPRVIEQGAVPHAAHRGQDLGDPARDLRIDRAGRPLQGADHARHARAGGLEAPDHRGPGPGSPAGADRPATSRSAAINRLTWAWAVLRDARLTTRRAVEVRISATSTSPLARRVSPDCTRSTMRSARPTSGASSMEPSRRTISTWMPRSEKYCSVSRGYLVATRTHDHFFGSSRSHSSRGS